MSELPPPGSRLQPGDYSGSRAPTNSLAIVSLVVSVLSFLANVIPIIGGAALSIIAIVTGFMARGQIRRSGEQGIWMANLGIIIGFVHLALGFIFLVLLLTAISVVGVTVWGITVHSGASPTPVPSG
ncbi:MAG TPA: DUF4190 domain-containing protein [Verrucomicrobiae bacterium]|nr:DUF4190 domain-containing protein [Verrucomicrobiae bacterium]